LSDCIFCKIVRGEIPAKVVYEGERVLAFDDVHPQAPVHTLVIPKEHFTNLQDDVPPELLGELFTSVREVARIKGVAETGYRVIVNNGPDANQTVPHLHIHILGGHHMTHGMVNLGPGQ